MKKTYIALALLIALLALTSTLGYARSLAATMVDTDADDGLPANIKPAVLTALETDPPEAGIDVYMITHYHTDTLNSGYYVMSVSGLDTGNPLDEIETDPQTLYSPYQQAVWSGNIFIYSETITVTVGIPGTITYTQLISDAGVSSVVSGLMDPLAYTPQTGGGWDVYFPWSPGSKAMYGPLGVHEGCYGLENDIAVDFFGNPNWSGEVMPNAIYAADSGPVNYLHVCDDGMQSVVIGDYGYLHINSSSISFYETQYIAKGQYIGSLVTGDYQDSGCGYTDQMPDSYHVHFCFQPRTGGYFQMEDYTLNIGTEKWLANGNYVSPSGYLYAAWEGNEPLPTATPGPTITPGGPTLTPTPVIVNPPGANSGATSMWDPLVYGVWEIIFRAAGVLPDHSEIGMAITITTAMGTILRVAFVLVRSNFDLTVTMFALGIIFIMEGWRLTTKLFRSVLRVIEWVLKFIPFIG